MSIIAKRRQTMEQAAKEVEEETARSIVSENTRVEFLTTGSTVLNLVLSGLGRKGGIARGRVINLVGDGSSGKTLLALEIIARVFYQLTRNPKTFPRVKKIIIVYNNVEGVMDFPLEKMYNRKDADGNLIKDGKQFTDAVEWIQENTVEGFGRDYTRRVLDLKEGEFLIYVTDSLDALVSEDSQERFIEAAEKDKSEDGSMGMEKQKYGGKFFGQLCGITKNKDATLIIISQIRENIGVKFGKKMKRAGGKAMDFYTHQVLWLAIRKHLTKTVLGIEGTYGVTVKAKLERSKVSKPYREGEFNVIFDYGIDRIISDLMFLYGPESKKVTLFGKSFVSYNEALKSIEAEGLEDKLSELVEEKWAKVEEGIKQERKAKF